jgi:phosphoserine phosphatase RsbU/P
MGPLGAAMQFDDAYSSIAAPMRTAEGPLGMITLAHHQAGRYGSEAQAITATFASYAAVAIQNARLFSEAQEQALISTMLLQVSEASQSTMAIDDLLATMLRLTRLLMGVKKCAFLLWEEGCSALCSKPGTALSRSPIRAATQRVFPTGLRGLQLLAEQRSILYLDDPGLEMDLPRCA